MTRKSRPEESPATPSFEDSLAALETIVQELEEGRVSLGDSLARYEAGVSHLKRCYEYLAEAERKIELLTGLDAEGRPVTVPFDEGATTLEEKAATRSQRRTSGSKTSSAKVVPHDIDDSDTLF